MTGKSISSQLDNKYIIENINKNNTSNTDDIHSCVPPQKQNYVVQSTSTTTCLTPLNTTLTIATVELYKKIPAGKEYLCFQINRRSSHAAQCFKSWIMNKYIDFILSIHTIEQQCVVIKGMLQSPRIEDHVNTIGIEQSSCNRYSFEYKFLINIKRYITMQVSVTTNKT